MGIPGPDADTAISTETSASSAAGRRSGAATVPEEAAMRTRQSVRHRDAGSRD